MAKKSPKFSWPLGGWKNKVIKHAQIGGIETSVLDNGLGKGTRIAWIKISTVLPGLATRVYLLPGRMPIRDWNGSIVLLAVC